MVIRTFEQKRLQPCKCIVLQNLVVSPQKKRKEKNVSYLIKPFGFFQKFIEHGGIFCPNISSTLHENWRADW